jgi:hypothetical protein
VFNTQFASYGARYDLAVTDPRPAENLDRVVDRLKSR